MKKFKKLLLLIVLASISLFIASSTEAADNYPTKWRNAAPNSLVDSWGMYNRNCTSYAAFRVSLVRNFQIKRYGRSWNAKEWAGNVTAFKSGKYGSAAKNYYKNTTVSKTPRVGSIAYTTGGPYGHVAYVAAVNSNGTINVSEYNYSNPYKYGVRKNIKASSFTGYIYFSK